VGQRLRRWRYTDLGRYAQSVGGDAIKGVAHHPPGARRAEPADIDGGGIALESGLVKELELVHNAWSGDDRSGKPHAMLVYVVVISPTACFQRPFPLIERMLAYWLSYQRFGVVTMALPI
jgi:hypothetical protein